MLRSYEVKKHCRKHQIGHTLTTGEFIRNQPPQGVQGVARMHRLRMGNACRAILALDALW